MGSLELFLIITGSLGLGLMVVDDVMLGLSLGILALDRGGNPWWDSSWNWNTPVPLRVGNWNICLSTSDKDCSSSVDSLRTCSGAHLKSRVR